MGTLYTTTYMQTTLYFLFEVYMYLNFWHQLIAEIHFCQSPKTCIIYVTLFGKMCLNALKLLIEIQLKVGNYFNINKYLKQIIFIIPYQALPLYELSKRLVVPALQASCLKTASFCSQSRGINGNSISSK